MSINRANIFNKRSTEGVSDFSSRFEPSKIYIGVVKDNVDESRHSSLKVWIKGSTSDPDDQTSWITVRYASPFAGTTELSNNNSSDKQSEQTQKSYGFWFAPPDIENEVLVCFVNGEITQGFWFACIPSFNMNYMVPGIPSGRTYQNIGGSNVLPSAEYNKRVEQPINNTMTRPYYRPLTEGLQKQGLLNDSTRGAGSSGVRRETPTRVNGILTPGGHQIVIDDGEENELIRFRTKSGAQILISETYGFIYLISRDGNTWFELSNEGHVDIYGAKDISIRGEGNVNIKADKQLNLEAEDINIKSTNDTKIDVERNFHTNTGGNVYHQADGTMNIKVGSLITSSGTISMTASSNGILSFDNFNIIATNYKSAISGDKSEKIDGFLETWSAESYSITDPTTNLGSKPASGIATPTSPTAASSAELPEVTRKTDKDFTRTGEWININDLQTIVTRLPQHEPWSDHATAPVGYREQVEEDITVPIKKGSTETETSQPLPLIGKPRQGMNEGVWLPKGYNNKGEPEYEYISSSSELVDVKTLTTSAKGLSLIAEHEGFRNKLYLDVARNETIGYGHMLTKAEKQANKFVNGITQEEGYELLQTDVNVAEKAIWKNVNVKMTQNQFDAIVSFIFNVGGGAFARSTLLVRLNQSRYGEVPSELMKWTKAGGKEWPGLVKRRRAEALLFTSSNEV